MTETLGRFQLLEHLDDGGTADVYRASAGDGNPDIALKVLKPELREQQDVVARFLDEGDLLRHMSHPGLPTVLATGTGDGCPYIAMELVRGKSLAEQLDQRGPIPEQQALAIAGDLADTLEHVHRAGMVHRDLKPANILLRDITGRAVIMDFGVARVTGEGAAGHMATPRYMSPEQASGESVDGRSDLFSLGVILFEMLAGRPPFEATSLEGLVDQVRHAEVPALPAGEGHSAEIVRRLLEKDPARRFASAAEARDAIIDASEAYSSAHVSVKGWLVGGAALAALAALWLLT